MNRDTVSASPRSSRIQRSHSQRAVTETASLQRAPEALPITDPSLAERLSTQPAPVVRCQLPKHLNLLKQLGERITHLELVLDQLDPTQLDGLIEDIRASLPGCKALTTLKLDVNVPSRHAGLVTWVSHAVINGKLPVESLTLSLNEDAEPSRSLGIDKLLELRPQLRLHFEGAPAGAMALKSMPASVEGPALVLSRIPSTDRAVIDALALQGPTKRAVEIGLDDENIDAFMQALLDAGVSSELSLQVTTPSGQSAHWQDAIAALERKHIEPLLQACTQDKRLDSAALLQACEALGKTGPMVFALACRTAIKAGLCGAPEVPVGQAAYLQALHKNAVPVVAVAVMPQDLAALKAANPLHVQGLRLDLGQAARLKERQLHTLDSALKRLVHLKSLKLQGHIDSTQPALGSFLPLEARWALKDLHIDIQGPAMPPTVLDARLIDFLRKTPPEHVTCTSEYGSSRLLACTMHVTKTEHLPMTLEVTLPAASLQTVADYLKRMDAPWLKLLIKVPEQLDPLPFQRELIDRLKPEANEFAIAQLHIVSLSHPVPNDAVVLGVAAEQIRLLMPTGKGPVKTVQALPMAGAFGLSLAIPEEVKTTLRDPLGMMADQWLEPSDRARLSASTKQVRSQTEITHNPAVVLPWLERQIQQRRPESYYRPILEGLFGKPFTDELLALAQGQQN